MKKGKQKQEIRLLSALEQYILSTEQSFARSIANMYSDEERQEKRLDRKVMLWEVEVARKYKLTPSALAMIARLMPELSLPMANWGKTTISELPGQGVWILLDDEKATNVYFSSVCLAYAAYRDLHPDIKLSELQARIAARNQWDLEIMARETRPLLYLYDANRHQWTLSHAHQCPVGRCAEISIDQSDRFPSWYICDVCMPAFLHWTAWFPVALLAINGHFAEREERQEPAIFRERSLRQKQTEKGQKAITHDYQIITFDISVKKAPAPHETTQGEPAHPTWLEQGIQDETILYVDKHIAGTQRTFRHERYINMRGKTIEVRAYDKRVPMSVRRLRATIYQAIASHEGQPSH